MENFAARSGGRKWSGDGDPKITDIGSYYWVAVLLSCCTFTEKSTNVTVQKSQAGVAIAITEVEKMQWETGKCY